MNRTQISESPEMKPAKMLRFWCHLRWPSRLVVGFLAASSLYANWPRVLIMEGQGFGFPFVWTWLNWEGSISYAPVAMAENVVFYAALMVFTALQVEHWIRNRLLQFRF